jgi:RNA polymerase sigma factor (sigma-70 family)
VASNPLTSVLHNLRLRNGAGQTDSQLLEAFLHNRDAVALEVLVRRHAPMVWAVCRRTLANHHEAEDAFQATFLVLLRKAVSIRSPELLANWLYRVAYKTARKARQRAAKGYSREKQVKVLPEPPVEPHDDTFGPGLREVLDEELGRLPEKYRIAVVLCDLECSTRKEAARQLNLPEGTVASRLATGRALLTKRLLRRGLGVSATSLAAAGFHQAALGAVPSTLLANTVKAVSLEAAGEATAAGLVTTEVSPLVDSVLRAMTAAKQKKAGVGLVLATLVLAGGMVAGHALETREAQPQPQPGKVMDLPGEVRRFPVEQWAWSVSFSPNGRRILMGVGGAGVPVRVCDFSTGQEVFRTDPYPSCWSTDYSPDGKFIAVGSAAKPIEMLDARTGDVRREFPPCAGVRHVTFSPDGRLIAASHFDWRLRLWDVALGRVLHEFSVDQRARHSAAFTPDGKLLVVVDPSNSLRLYEVDSGKEVRRFEGHTAQVWGVAVSADGRHALSCSGDATLRLWDLQTGKELRRMQGHDGIVESVAFCPDGRRALSGGGGDKTVRLWDLVTGRELYRFDGHDETVAEPTHQIAHVIAAQGLAIPSGGAPSFPQVVVASKVASLDEPAPGRVVCVAVSPDGRYALSGGSDHTVRVWRLPDPALPPEK